MMTETIDESSWDNAEKKERRGRKRYQITMRACFRWQDSDGSWHKGAGTTQDISSHGVFILADPAPPLGAVKVAVTVPPTRSNAAGKVMLAGKGVVLRVVPNAGFATQVALRLTNSTEKGSSNFC